jgi:hypothetical protein
MGKQDPPFGERFKESLGAAEGLPSNLAAQHDHYRLGTQKKLPTFTDDDERIFVVLATSGTFDLLNMLADEVRKRIYGYDVLDWVEHLEDVFVRYGHTHQLLVEGAKWINLSEQDQESLIIYSQGFVEAARD